MLLACAQALNNWGLVLQELAAMRPPAERAALVALSSDKFRRAMALRPEFDRACYNLVTQFFGGSVGHCCVHAEGGKQCWSASWPVLRPADAGHRLLCARVPAAAVYAATPVCRPDPGEQPSWLAGGSLKPREAGRSQDAGDAQRESHQEAAVRSAFGLAAQYIVLAAMLQPSREVYRRSLGQVPPTAYQ